MNKTSIFLILLAVIAAKLSAQEGKTGIESRLRYNIGALSHDSMFGREAGSASEMKAALFIEAAFRNDGLKPYDPGTGSYLKPFKFGPLLYKKSSLSINGVKYRSGVDFGAVAGSSDGELQAAIVENKIFPLKSEEAVKDIRSKPTVYLIDLKHEKLNLDQPENPVNMAVQDGYAAILLSNAYEPDFKNRLFNADSTVLFPVPVFYITADLAIQITKIENPTCEIEVSIDRKRPAAYNVIGFVDNGAKKTAVVGGHFDHVGTPGSENPVIGDPNICNGADDNASGTAAVMELARWASQQKNLKYNYLFIAFSAEEKGLFGSWNFCNSVDFRKYDFAWMLNLDMVGRLAWNGKNRLTVEGVASSHEWKSLLNKTEHKAFTLLRIKGAPGYSDHFPFVKHHIPVIYFSTGLEHEYHKPVDDANLINYAGEAAIIEYLERLMQNAEKIENPGFHKISGWQNFKAFISGLVFRR